MEEKLLKHIKSCIHNRESFHEQIPNVGKVVFNKVVPYFFLYRTVGSVAKQRMISDLAKSQLSSIIFKYDDENVDNWIKEIAQELKSEFGSCLIIEIWTDNDKEDDISIHIAQKVALPLAEYIHKNIRTEAPDLHSSIVKQRKTPHNPDYKPLFSLNKLQEDNIYLLGISTKNTFINTAGSILPLLERHFRESMSKALSRTFFEYLRLYTNLNPGKFKLNVHKEITSNIFEIDKALLAESQRFDFLMLVTPTNVQEAWQTFKNSRYAKNPVFQYRPMPIDPDLVKRNLYNLPIEDIYDPNIAYLFRDKRRELDEMMSMLADRNTPDFVHGSLQVFGNVSDKLLNVAEAIITVIDNNKTNTPKGEEKLNAHQFAQLATQEIEYLKLQYPELNTTVRVRNDVSGVMVNRGVLNISSNYKVSKERAEALIQHEVGTHIATYFNGKSQLLQLFSQGVPGYEKLQEGLAVFAEYMVDGLNNERLRILAARVICVRHMLMGNSFIDTFSMLVEQYDFADEIAFLITMRVYRGGGLTKDAVYLQGLIELLEYLRAGNDINILTIGKIRKDYIPIIQDLIQRGYLRSPAIIPRYLSDVYLSRLELIRKEGSIFKLIK
ncbi:MAG TPA: tyrosine/phenylalanine carboxypeptidase domain-containing protein [Sphingobacterium bovisgrunnientis]|nr:tyrosine/phenylalanine carboxypeptidase domain-containing protein [Sphingobacterium bovisgrunnientis]